ncbi:MAG: hypothetical protein ACRAVC_18325 [Trichormus sp.]
MVTVAGNKPITIGQGYSTIAWIPEDSGSWALPLRHERITSWENPIQKAAWQLQQVCENLPTRPIKVSLWLNLHFRKTATRPMSLIRVERLDADGNLRVSKPLWLAWVGEEMPPLEEVWQLYLRRFTVDHWYRFLKQRLHWTLPKLSTPKQCEHWRDLMPLMTWELWLARDIVADNPLPWQKPLDNLTPGRVAQAMGSILAAIGTPARPPKPRGKSPGWKTGQPRQRRIRYPVVKKTTTRPRKKQSESA